MAHKFIFALCTFLLSSLLYAQEATVKKTLTVTDLESLFLASNYELLIAKYEIERAEAEILQQRLFPNPTLAISELNLWSNRTHEQLAPLFGRYGRSQQFGVDLEQLIETAGKRKKRVHIAQLEKTDAQLDFEETLLNLRYDLRNTFHALQKVTAQEQQVAVLVDQFSQLSEQYERHANLQTINRADFFRIQSATISWKEELVSLQDEQLEHLDRLKRYTHLPDLRLQDLALSLRTEGQLTSLIPANLQELAYNNHLDLKRAQNNQSLAQSELKLEEANRVPDLNIGISYDRGGNIMRDFVGFGISMDLPLFNKNQGNIRAAKLRIQQEESARSGLRMALDNTLEKLVSQLRLYENALDGQPAELTENFSLILENYAKNLRAQQVTLMEFIDFSESYVDAQKAFLQLQEKYYQTFEELKYTIGKDL
ncbi:TolC family protein [Sphingobacterium pedocola]|uniref:Transporter n=1 Tax=Sphingobacterium pedocola TaxID=2082722 RepID=A0ABR9T9T0_9SPHI|nr:TolC family protein [Sphingobacterium pedocola]MBE8722101.1 hypothetical protein [Sphingobacterium pedocola]